MEAWDWSEGPLAGCSDLGPQAVLSRKAAEELRGDVRHRLCYAYLYFNVLAEYSILNVAFLSRQQREASLRLAGS